MKSGASRLIAVLTLLVATTGMLSPAAGETGGTRRTAAAGDEAGPPGKQPPQQLRMEPLPSPGYLPELARASLRRRMVRHGDDMMQLVLAVTLLQHDAARAAAERMASEPTLARPAPGEQELLNAALPARFFAIQDELRKRAMEVSRAARAKDDGALAAAFGKLSETCVQCHSVYLRPPKS